MIHFVSDTITIRRKRYTSGFKRAFSATYTAYDADIQPIQAERAINSDQTIGKTYEAWVGEDVPVKEGDQIVSGSKTYNVTAVSDFSGVGLQSHKYLILAARD